jgi:flagellar protein FliS
MRLYDFMYLMLVEANVAKDREKVSVVRGMLEELRSTWEEAIIKLAEESGEKAAPQFLRGSASAVKDDAKAVPAGGLNVAG